MEDEEATRKTIINQIPTTLHYRRRRRRRLRRGCGETIATRYRQASNSSNNRKVQRRGRMSRILLPYLVDTRGLAWTINHAK